MKNLGRMLEVVSLGSNNADLDTERIVHSNAHGVKVVKPFKRPADIRNSELVPESVSDESLSEIRDTEQMKSYKKMVEFYGRFGFLFGIVVRYDWKMERHAMFWWTNLSLLCAAGTVLYTMFAHYSNGDYTRILEPLAILGITGSSWLKWFCHLTKWRKIFSLIFNPQKLCMRNATGVRAEIINAGLQKTLKVIKVYALGVIMCLCLSCVIPIKYYFLDNVWMLLPIDIGVDQTFSGFMTLYLIQVEFASFSFLATIMFGSGFIICICNYTFMIDLIEQDFKDLDEMWNGSSRTTLAYRRAFLANICKKMQDMKSYMKTVKEIYEQKFFMYFLTSYFSQIICLYEITESDWILGYAIALICFIEMMSYCIIGQQISIGDDKVCHIVGRTNWYTYDLKSQRILQMIMHQRQIPNHLKLGPLGTLNILTGIQVLKSIYTYYAIMKEVL